MSKYQIISDRIGTPGDVYEPAEGINVEALIEAGFIKQTSGKSAKTEETPQEEN